jgi:hypothetical protein
MNIKYADVMRAEQVADYLDSLPAGLYDWPAGSHVNAR